MRERTPEDLSVLLDDDGKAWLPCDLDGEYTASAAKRIQECAAAWEADRARIATLEAELDDARGYAKEVADALFRADDRERTDRARIATLTAQRDALVPLAKLGADESDMAHAMFGRPVDGELAAARAALAAIAAERETTTEEASRD